MPARHRRTLRQVGYAAGAVLLLALGLGAWSGVAAYSAAAQLRAVRADLSTLSSRPPADAAALDRRMAAAGRRLDRAHGLLDQPGPRAVAAVPVLGRSLRAERTVTEAARAVLGSARILAGAAERVARPGGSLDLAALATTSADLDAAARRTEGPLARLRNTNTALTPVPVVRGVREAQDQLLGLDATLRRAADAASALHGIFGGGGPRTVLVGLQNNAELRGTGGLVTTYAIGSAANGRLELGAFEDVLDVADTPPQPVRAVPAPADYVAHYGVYLANTTLWKNANMAPDVPTSAGVLAEIAGTTLGRRPDVVVLLDVPTMARVVSVTGDIHLRDGTRLDEGSLVQALLVDAYQTGTDDAYSQRTRRRELQSAATKAVHRIVAGSRPSVRLLRALTEAADGRHLAVWSARPAEQAALVRAGLAGSADPQGDDLAMATVNNIGGDKLDYYADRGLAVRVTVGSTHAEVRQTLTLANAAPAGLRTYVAGVTTPGRTESTLDLAAAPDADHISFLQDGRPVPTEVRTESGSTRVLAYPSIDRGARSTWELSYRVPVRPDGTYRLRLVPQPLAAPAQLDLEVRAADGVRLTTLEGASLPDGQVRYQGPWDEVRSVGVRLDQPAAWERLRTRVAAVWRGGIDLG